jgi:hypothetical protein
MAKSGLEQALALRLLRFALGAHRFFQVIEMFSMASEIIILAIFLIYH